MNGEKGKCFRCGIQNEVHEKFCRGCGNALQDNEDYKSKIEISRVEIERIQIGGYESKVVETVFLEEKVQSEQTSFNQEKTLKEVIVHEVIEAKKQSESNEKENTEKNVTIDRRGERGRKYYKKIILVGIVGMISLCLFINFFLIVNIPKEKTMSLEMDNRDGLGIGSDHSTRRFLSFNYSGEDDSNSGLLYFHSVDRVVVVAQEVLDGPFLLGNRSDNIVYMQSDGVYIMNLESRPYKIMEHTNIVELTFTDDDRYLILRNNEDKYYIYDVQQEGFKKASQTYKKQGNYLLEGKETCYGTYVDTLHNDLYYIDVYSTLYRLKDFREEEKIAEDVWSFKVLNSRTLVYESFEEDDEFYVCTLDNEIVIEELGFYVENISEVTASSQGEVIFGIGSTDKETYYEDSYLYIKGRGKSPVQIMEYTYEWKYVEANDTLYYLDDKDDLRSIKISKKGKTHGKEKLVAENVRDFDVSEDGHNIGIRTWRERLYLYRENQILELDEDIREYSVYNDAIIYASNQDKLYVATNLMIDTEGKLSANQKQITDLLRKQFMSGENERYMIYLEAQGSETDSPIRLKRYDLYNGESIELLSDINEKDNVLYGQTKYYKDLRGDEVFGYYLCNDGDFALTLGEDGEIALYVEGEKRQTDQFIYHDIEEKNSVQIELVNSYFLSRNSKNEYNEEENILNIISILSKKSEAEYTLANYEYCYKLLRISQEAFEAYCSEYLN